MERLLLRQSRDPDVSALNVDPEVMRFLLRVLDRHRCDVMLDPLRMPCTTPAVARRHDPGSARGGTWRTAPTTRS
jgi:hypothetical protein